MGLGQGRLAAAEHAAAMPPGVRLCLHAANVSAHISCLLEPPSARAQAPPQNAYPQAQQPQQTYAPSANGNTNWERYGPGAHSQAAQAWCRAPWHVLRDRALDVCRTRMKAARSHKYSRRSIILTSSLSLVV